MTNPVTRFKQNDGKNFPNWDIKLLGEVAKIKGGSSFPLRLQNEETKEIPFFKVSDMNNPVNTVFLFLSNKYISRKTAEKEKYSYFNSDGIVLAKVGAALLLDRKRIAKAPFLIDNNLISIFPKESIDLQYLYYWTLRIRFSSLSQTGALPSISTNQIEKLFVGIPTKLEQQKIASFFSTLDQKIELNERKLEALEKLKKGLMQKIFSQAIRFKAKDGHDFDDWKTFKIDDVAFIRGGGTPSTKNEYYWNGNIQWMTPTEINSKYVHKSLRTITKLGLDNSSAKLLPKGAILLTTRATIGACSINNFDGDVCTNQGFQSLICKQNIIPEFLYYSISNPVFQKEMQKNASGSTFLEISSTTLKKLTLQVPSIEEQESISTFLSVFDEKIDLIKTKICALKQLKQGFMQQMFV